MANYMHFFAFLVLAETVYVDGVTVEVAKHAVSYKCKRVLFEKKKVLKCIEFNEYVLLLMMYGLEIIYFNSIERLSAVGHRRQPLGGALLPLALLFTH